VSERYAPEDPREWLNRARNNLALARMQGEGVYLEALCFNTQQAYCPLFRTRQRAEVRTQTYRSALHPLTLPLCCNGAGRTSSSFRHWPPLAKRNNVSDLTHAPLPRVAS
jgi:hypothetical protein